MSSEAEWRAGPPAPLQLRAIEAGVFVPSLLTKSRQYRIGPYFADFRGVAQHLIIELDGSQHAEPEEERKDGLRTAYLNQQGYRVIRFWNEQVNSELEGVLAKLFIQP
jgi:very-short-patch-repair endonuclease